MLKRIVLHFCSCTIPKRNESLFCFMIGVPRFHVHPLWSHTWKWNRRHWLIGLDFGTQLQWKLIGRGWQQGQKQRLRTEEVNLCGGRQNHGDEGMMIERVWEIEIWEFDEKLELLIERPGPYGLVSEVEKLSVKTNHRKNDFWDRSCEFDNTSVAKSEIITRR